MVHHLRVGVDHHDQDGHCKEQVEEDGDCRPLDEPHVPGKVPLAMPGHLHGKADIRVPPPLAHVHHANIHDCSYHGIYRAVVNVKPGKDPKLYDEQTKWYECPESEVGKENAVATNSEEEENDIDGNNLE